MSDTAYTYDEDKSEAENFVAYQELLADLEMQKAEDYDEAGTAPPGVVTRNPDSTTPEANYVSRDNIVVSGASPHNVQAAVNAAGEDEVVRNSLDAADVAQGLTRKQYEDAVLSAAPGATDSGPEDEAELGEEPEGPKVAAVVTEERDAPEPKPDDEA